jgi:hypothetical protein
MDTHLDAASTPSKVYDHVKVAEFSDRVTSSFTFPEVTVEFYQQ